MDRLQLKSEIVPGFASEHTTHDIAKKQYTIYSAIMSRGLTLRHAASKRRT